MAGPGKIGLLDGCGTAGLAVALCFLAYRWHDMPPLISDIGMVFGITLMLVGFGPRLGLLFKCLIRATDDTAYIRAYEAFHYMADKSEWGISNSKQIDQFGARNLVLLNTPSEFKDAAQEGKVRVLGRSGGSGPHVEIPATDWFTITVDMNTVLRKQSEQTVPAVPHQQGIPYYTDLRILRADVYKTWPMSLRKRLFNFLRRILT